VLSEGSTVDEIVISRSSLPNHDTTKLLRVTLDVGLDEGLDLSRSQVVARVAGILRAGKTNVELGILVGAIADDINPRVEVEHASAVNTGGGRAGCGVVPLHPEEIEDRVVNGIAKLGIGGGALGSTGDVEGLFRDLLVVCAETVDHGRPSSASMALNVEIESINRDV
jgi:hypothetical protein